MENSESKNEYERIRKMNHQLYIMKKNKKAIRSKWRQSREMLEEVIKTLSDKEIKLKEALDNSITALLRMVVSSDHDGRWGIVNSDRESVIFPTAEGVEEEYWFDGNYIFRFEKEIKDYSKILEKYGFEDEE